MKFKKCRPLSQLKHWKRVSKPGLLMIFMALMCVNLQRAGIKIYIGDDANGAPKYQDFTTQSGVIDFIKEKIGSHTEVRFQINRDNTTTVLCNSDNADYWINYNGWSVYKKAGDSFSLLANKGTELKNRALQYAMYYSGRGSKALKIVPKTAKETAQALLFPKEFEAMSTLSDTPVRFLDSRKNEIDIPVAPKIKLSIWNETAGKAQEVELTRADFCNKILPMFDKKILITSKTTLNELKVEKQQRSIAKGGYVYLLLSV